MPQPRRRAPHSPSTPPPLARELHERRLELGLTQEQVADLACVSRSTLQSLETGRSSPRLAAVLAVADVLGCTLLLVTHAEASERSGS